MNKSIRQLMVIILAVLLMLQVDAAKASTAGQINELKKQIAELQSLAKKYQNNILEKQNEADTLNRQISILENDIARLAAQLDATDKDIELTSLEIESLTNQASVAITKIETHKKALGAVVRNINEMDGTKTLEVLFSSSTLADFADQLEQSRAYTSQLGTIVFELKNEKTRLDLARAEMASRKNDLTVLNRRRQAQVSSFETVKSSKSSLLVRTKGDEKKYKELLSAAEKKHADFIRELTRLEEEALKNNATIVDIKVANLPPAGTKLFDFPYDSHRMTQPYGWSGYARAGAYGGQPHSGIDLVAGYGSEIKSIGAGKIVASAANAPGWGNWVAVHHENDFVSLYAHMSRPTHLKVGDRVDNTTVIGYEGSTGNSTGSHLHLSLYRHFFTYINPKNGLLYPSYNIGTVDPLDYIK